MDIKALIFTLALLLFAPLANAQTEHPDSVVQHVFRTITGLPQPLPSKTDSLLHDFEWEALAYWDTLHPKKLAYLEEAVGDVYQFTKTNFALKLVDPQQPRSYLQTITGTYARQGRKLQLLAQNGKALTLYIVFLDSNYLVLEVDGLCMFFSKQFSY